VRPLSHKIEETGKYKKIKFFKMIHLCQNNGKMQLKVNFLLIFNLIISKMFKDKLQISKIPWTLFCKIILGIRNESLSLIDYQIWWIFKNNKCKESKLVLSF